ncbi:NF-kappa-B inhibitor cactus isoform X2 [Anabrus simplex]|uniref:NF-kappa-B inhibitor cactus isoform X2 n=1 Tax=Anabrus simplex TaxID=316456 RepID=UPI0035A3C917
MPSTTLLIVNQEPGTADCTSGPPNTGRYPHGGVPPRQVGLTGYSTEQEQWKSSVGMKGGYSGDSGIYDSSRTDSGFLSGANIVSDQLLSDDLTSSIGRKSRDLTALSEEGKDSDLKALMRLDSGVDVGLNEQLSSLSIDQNTSLNDLNVSTKSQSQDSTPLTNINDLSSSRSSAASQTSLHHHHPHQQHHHRQQPQQHHQQQSSYQLYITQPWDLYFQQDEDGDTQLHIAIIQGFIEVVYSLIHMVPHPGYLDIPNDVCQTPLHLAVLTHQPRIVRRLLVAGARVDVRDREGNTALHLACEIGDLECVRSLMEPITVAEAQTASLQYSSYQQQVPQDLEERNYDGQMCIHLAAQHGHIDVLRHLLWFGANINAKDGKSGRTVLHYAIEQRLPRLCRFLLEECAPQLEVPTYAGYTAYQLASCIDAAMANQLIEKGAVARDLPEDSDSDSDYSDDEMYQISSDDSFSSLRLNGQPINISA